MITIAIKLDPEKLENPDTDLRYAIPQTVSEQSSVKITDEGFDYLNDGSMAVFIGVQTRSDVSEVLDVLKNERILENRITDSAIVGVDEGQGYDVVFPEGYEEDFVIEE